MICPHCKTGIHQNFASTPIIYTQDKLGASYGWRAKYQRCPECAEVMVYLERGHWTSDHQQVPQQNLSPSEKHLVWPQDGFRLCPTNVPDPIRKDFLEAAAVLPRSSQASAALTRRCLQHVLRDCAGTKSKDLARQIEEVIPTLPPSLGDQLDAVRTIGNFAAHPMKSTNSGEIIEVEPQEAEWNLDVLAELFDHYFVKPAQLQKRKQDLNKKLADAGKPQLT